MFIKYRLCQPIDKFLGLEPSNKTLTVKIEFCVSKFQVYAIECKKFYSKAISGLSIKENIT